MKRRNISIFFVVILVCIIGVLILQLSLKSNDKKNGERNSMIIGNEDVMYVDLTDDTVDYEKELQNHTADTKSNDVIEDGKNDSKLVENNNENKQEEKNEKNDENNNIKIKNEKYYNIQIDLKNNIVIADNETKSIKDFFELDEAQAEKITNSEENLKNYLKENMMGDIEFSGNVINIDNAFSTLAIIIKTYKFSQIKSLGNVDYVTKVADSVYIIHYKNAKDTKDGYDLLSEDTNVEMVLKDEKTMNEDSTEDIVEINENVENSVQEANNVQERATARHSKHAWGVKTTGMYKYAKFIEKKSYSKIVRVAVVDSGIRTTHEVFKNRIDMNGAYNFKDNNTDIYDWDGHGTMVAGILAEATPRNVMIVPIERADNSFSRTLEAFRYAVGKVDIINCSFGAYYTDEVKTVWDEVLKEAKDKNTIVVCSSGNDGAKTGYDYENHYPSASPYTISVGATDINRKKADFSNYASSVDFTAPGAALRVPTRDGDDTYASGVKGTSLSSPLVAAAFALLKTENPSYSVDQLKTELIKHCDDLGTAGKDKYYGYGEVNFFKNKFSTPAIVEADSEQKWGKGEVFTLSVEGINNVTHYYRSSEPTAPSNEQWKEIQFKNSGIHKTFNMSFGSQRNGTKYIWFKDEDGNVSERFEYEVKYVDDIKPIIVENLSCFDITQNSFKAKFKAKDIQTGIKKIKWYCKQEGENEYVTSEAVFDEPTLEVIERSLQKSAIKSNCKTQVYAEIYDAADNCQKTNEITVSTLESPVSSISVQTKPTKIVYAKGENLNLDGGEIKVTHEDKTTEIINMNDSEVSVTGYNSQTLGKQTLTIKYKEKTTTLEIQVINKITSIDIQTNPTKTTYIKGEVLDLTGGKLQITYEDQTTEIIDMKGANVSVTGFDSQIIGEQIITVKYKEKTTTFKIKVKNDLVKIEIENKPNKTIYFIGENFEREGMKVIATYEDNTKKEITKYDIVEGDDLTLETEKVTIKYTENEITKTVEQKIKVLDKSKEQLVIEGKEEAKVGETQVLKVKLYSQQLICHLSGIIQKNEYITDMKLVEQNDWKIQYNAVTGEFDLEKVEGAKTEEILNIEITTSDKEGKGEILLTNIKMVTKDAETIKINDVQNSVEIKKDVVLTGIKIVKKPDKLVYSVGERFDKKGMEILAEYSDGTSKKITNYTYSPSDNLEINDNKIVISYTEEHISQKVELEIEVNNIPEKNDNDESENINVSGNKKDSTIAKTELPKAGYKMKIIYMLIIVISIVSIYLYSFIKKYKKI